MNDTLKIIALITTVAALSILSVMGNSHTSTISFDVDTIALRRRLQYQEDQARHYRALARRTFSFGLANSYRETAQTWERAADTTRMKLYPFI